METVQYLGKSIQAGEGAQTHPQPEMDKHPSNVQSGGVINDFSKYFKEYFNNLS